MASLNRVVITGRVATPPHRQYQPDGTPVLQFPLELNDTGPVKSLIPIVVFGRLAESKPDLQSGQRLLVKGRLRQRRWQTPEGRNRIRTEVIASELHPVEKASPSEGDEI